MPKHVSSHKQKLNYLLMGTLTHWGRGKIADDIFKCIFLKENIWILIKISLSLFTWPNANSLDQNIFTEENVFENAICKTSAILSRPQCVNTLRPRQNGRHFADAIFKCVFVNENVGIPIKISLNFVPQGPINNIPSLVQIMAWRRPGDKSLSETMLVSLLTHTCVTRPQWVKWNFAWPEANFWDNTCSIQMQ